MKYDYNRRVYYKYNGLWHVGRVISYDKQTNKYLIMSDDEKFEMWCTEDGIQSLSNVSASFDVLGTSAVQPPATKKKIKNALKVQTHKAILKQLQTSKFSINYDTRRN